MFQNSPGKSSGVTTSTVPAGTVIPGMTTLPVFRPLNPSAGRVQLSNPTLTTNSDGNLVLSVKLPANLAPGLPSAKIIPQGGGSECNKKLFESANLQFLYQYWMKIGKFYQNCTFFVSGLHICYAYRKQSTF